MRWVDTRVHLSFNCKVVDDAAPEVSEHKDKYPKCLVFWFVFYSVDNHPDPETKQYKRTDNKYRKSSGPEDWVTDRHHGWVRVRTTHQPHSRSCCLCAVGNDCVKSVHLSLDTTYKPVADEYQYTPH